MLAFAALLCLSTAAPVLTAEVSRRPTPTALTVAILDLAEAPDLAPTPPPKPEQPAWRTTFGSERKSEPERKAIAAGSGPLAAIADSDAVLIQGVRDAASLRRLFPPRTWRLIVSRRIAVPSDPSPSAEVELARADLPATTAIAVKARQTLRVTARALALRLEGGEIDVGESGEEAPETPSSAAAPSLLAPATAVRLVERGRALWVASVALPASCAQTDGSDPCPAWSGLESWRADKRKAGDATLIGGRLAGKNSVQLAAETPQACASHRIETDLQSEILPRDETIPLSQTGTGCVSIVRIGG